MRVWETKCLLLGVCVQCVAIFFMKNMLALPPAKCVHTNRIGNGLRQKRTLPQFLLFHIREIDQGHADASFDVFVGPTGRYFR